MARKHKKRRNNREAETQGSTTVIRFTPEELEAQTIKAAEDAGRLAREVESLLRTEGPADPRKWTQTELRAQVSAFNREGLRHEALAVEHYADARMAWSRAIQVYQRAADKRSRRPKAKSTAVNKSKTTIPAAAGSRSVCWVGRKVMPPAEPWHATVPPWEDGPEGSRVEW